MTHTGTERRPAPPADTAVEGCLDACRRFETVLDRLEALPADQARPALGLLGPHLRHVLDFLCCLLRGLASGRVDYDARERDPALERDADRLREALRETVGALLRLDGAALSRPLRVRQTAAPGRPPVTVSSTVSRELVFCAGHTIHHIAIMEALARERGLSLPRGLSLACSTAAHRARVGRERG